MRTFALLLPLTVLTTTSPAIAQAVRAYACTLDGSNAVVRFQFGAGELRSFYKRDGVWSPNWCAVSNAKCRFEGSRFIAEDTDFDFGYDAST